MRKDLAYSKEQLNTFLQKMEHVEKLALDSYLYKNATIKLEEKEMLSQESFVKIPRAYMYLEGDEQDIEQFYTSFLLRHLTMGG